MSNTAGINIIPKPVVSQQGNPKFDFTINTNTQIYIENDSLLNAAQFFVGYLQEHYHLQLKITNTQPSKNAIHLISQTTFQAFKDNYNLAMQENKIVINGNSSAGVFYGIQSLIQLLPTTKSTTLKIPSLSIIDYPRFAYRGMHLDVSRHFLT